MCCVEEGEGTENAYNGFRFLPMIMMSTSILLAYLSTTTTTHDDVDYYVDVYQKNTKNGTQQTHNLYVVVLYV